jgi:hypothetical protein
MSAQADAAIVEARVRAYDRAATAKARSRKLGTRIAEARARHEVLRERTAELRHACRVQRATGHTVRTRWRGSPALGQFLVEGLVDGELVAAVWSDGRLDCDDRLRARALILVDLEEEFVYTDPPRCFIATLEGPPIAVALTLIRACDRVTRIVLAPAA